MKNILPVVFSLCAVTARAADGCDLDCSLNGMLQQERLTGVVYSLVQGEETRSGAAGVANFHTGERLRADSKVHIGSVTKTLVALGLLRLATQGRVDLDASIASLLPHLPLENPWHSRSPVTLRHLLDHTSGLDDLRFWQIFTAHAPARAPLKDAFARPPGLLRVRAEPGMHFSYSNMGYTLAAMVIEARTGQSYESWLDREMLSPLGMSDSTFEFVSQRGPDADARLAWGHYDDFSLAGAQPVWVRPATQFTTTAPDMARLARFLMGDGRIDGAVFIDETWLRQMGQASTTRAAREGLEVGYALGLATRDRHGAVGLCHLGNTVGFRAALCVYPRQGKAWFISHNTDSESAQYLRFDELLTRELGVVTATAPRVITPDAARLAWQGRYVAAPARFESFRYLDLLFDSVSTRVGTSGIELHRLGVAPVQLTPAGPALYRGPERSVASHVLFASGGEHFIGDGSRTLRKISGGLFALNWVSFVLGLVGLLVLLILIPWRALRRGETWRQPASAALLLLLVTAPLFAFQAFTELGDLTAASASLYFASLALPLLMAIHIAWAVRNRRQLRSSLVHVTAAAFVLQWCASLWAWDLLPLALWR